MNTQITIRPEVLAFAQLMELRLRDKDEDKGQSWKDLKPGYLRVAMFSKASRLDRELNMIDKGMQVDTPHVLQHAVDLANNCMFIADVAGVLDTPVPVNKLTDRADWEQIIALGEAQA